MSPKILPPNPGSVSLPDRSIDEHQDPFRALADGTPVIMWVTDTYGRMEFVNRAYTQFFGVTLEQVQSGGWQPLVHPEDAPCYLNAYMECLRERRPFRAQGRVHRADGQWRWVESHGQPRFSESGEYLGMAGSSFDITEQKQMEQELADSERRFRELVQYAPTAIYEVDFRTGRFTSVNDLMVQLSGYSRKELLEMNAADLLDEKSRARFRERVNQWLAGETPNESVEYRVRAKDGHIIYAMLSVTFTKDEEGRPLGATVIAHDITERKQAEIALRASEEQLAIIFEILPVGVGLVDTQGRMLLANQEMRRFVPTGIIPSRDEERYGRWRGHHPDGSRIERRDYAGARALRGERVLPGVEFLYTHDDGREIWASVAALPVRDSEGQITGAVTMVTDIDAGKRATEALRQSEERFRSSIESLTEAFIIFSAVRKNGEIVDLRYQYVNEEACHIQLRTREQLVEHDLLEVFPVAKELGLFARLVQVIETGQPLKGQQYTFQSKRSASPAQVIFDFHGSKFGDGLIVTANDITEQLRLEEENQRAIRDREIHHRLSEQREMERQSYARDIHDGPIQTLSSLAFSLQFLKEVYPDPSLRVELDQIGLSIKAAVQELRQVMNELRPPTVIRFGLAKAIRVHAEALRERYPHMQWNLRLSEDGQLLPEQTCLTMFRIYQEAVNNIIRHAEASIAWINYRTHPDSVTLEIRDNGKGFSEAHDVVSLINNRHFGLAGISERAEAIHGKLELRSRPGEGTSIKVKVPLQAKENGKNPG